MPLSVVVRGGGHGIASVCRASQSMSERRMTDDIPARPMSPSITVKRNGVTITLTDGIRTGFGMLPA